MSDQSAPPRSAQADELIAAVTKNSISNAALAAAIGALVIAVNWNNDLLEESLALDAEEDEHADDCDDEDCEGECLDEPEPSPRKRRAKKRG